MESKTNNLDQKYADTSLKMSDRTRTLLSRRPHYLFQDKRSNEKAEDVTTEASDETKKVFSRTARDQKNSYNLPKREKKPWDPDYDPSLPNGGLEPEDVQAGFGEYLFGKTFERPLERDKNVFRDPWAKSFGGRAAIRIFSRGILGSALFMWGQTQITRQLSEYSHVGKLNELHNGQAFMPLRYIARGFDITYGKGVENLAYGIARFAGKSVEDARAIGHSYFMQRGARYFAREAEMGTEAFMHYMEANGLGRSIGADMVGMTFDFAMGSVGDAMGRAIANIFDPNYPKDWMIGGKFNEKAFVNHLGRTVWKTLTYNQLEDWFAAPFYIPQMRAQRYILNKVFPGFKYVADHQRNGGGHVFSEDGTALRSFALPGLLDLQFRFMGYNWYTLMFRDLHKEIKDRWRDWRSEGYPVGVPEISLNPVELASDVVGGVGHTARYVTKSLMKSAIYMAPAVPFFWVTRTPQTLFKGIPMMEVNGEVRPLTAKQYGDHLIDTFDYRSLDPSGETTVYAGAKPIKLKHIVDGKYAEWPIQGKGVAGTGRLLKWPGKFTNWIGEGLAARTKNFSKFITGTTHEMQHNTFMRDFANASLAYTPYMIAKGETAILYDNALMDKALYKTIDGLTELDRHKIISGVRTVQNLITHPPISLVDQSASRQTGLDRAKEKHQRARVKHQESMIKEAIAKGVSFAPYAQHMVPKQMIEKVGSKVANAPTPAIRGAKLDGPVYEGLTKPSAQHQGYRETLNRYEEAALEAPDSMVDASSVEQEPRIALDPNYVSKELH